MTGSDGAISAAADRVVATVRTCPPTSSPSSSTAQIPPAQARFWSTATGWPAVERRADRWWAVRPPAGEPGLPIELVQVDDPKVGKNRVHLDLSSRQGGDQQAIVDRLLAAGATPVDVGQRDVPWVVLADPEGNELCVLEHRAAFDGRGRLAGVVVHTVDPDATAEFWTAATGWPARAPVSDRTIALCVARRSRTVPRARPHRRVEGGQEPAPPRRRPTRRRATRPPRCTGCWPWVPPGPTSGKVPTSAGSCSPIPRATGLCVLQPGAEA